MFARNAIAWMRALVADRRGSVAVLTVGFGVCAIASLALAVDVASIHAERRKVQGAVDLAAMAAARDLDNATGVARTTLSANGFKAPKALAVTRGNYVADPASAAGVRFKANATPYNAVRVSVEADAPLYFSRAMVRAETLPVRGAAIAATTKLASFSIGSRLASLNGGVANALLSGLFGGSVSLSLADYNALAAAKIEILPLLTALGSRIGLTAGTYDQVLGAKVKATEFINAMADVSQGSATVAAALRRMALTVDATRLVDVGKLIALGPYGNLRVGKSGAGLAVAASALELLNVSAQAANGKNQVALNLGAQVPGLLGLTGSLSIGERMQNAPWLSVGGPEAIVRTAQVRLRLMAEVGGTGTLLGKVISLPIAVDVAAGEARISKVTCGTDPGADARVSVMARPSAAELWLAEPTNLAQWNAGSANPAMTRATLLNVLLLLKATAYAHVAASNVSEQALSFTPAEMKAMTPKTVKTTNVLQTTLSSLTSALEVKVELLGLSLGVTSAATEALLKTILVPVGALLDPVVNSLLGVLGVSLGEADVIVRGVRCDGSALVG